MNQRLVSLPGRHAIAAGMIVLGLAIACAGDGATPADRDKKPTAAKMRKEELRYAGKSFEQWRERTFTDLSPKVHVEALKAMGAFGKKGYGSEAAAEILKLMGDYETGTADEDITDEKVRLAAINALVKIGPATLPLLQRGLQDTNGNVRRFAIQALPAFGEEAKPAIPALLQTIKTGDVNARIAAMEAVDSIIGISDSDRRFISALLDALKDKETEVRRAAAQQLRFRLVFLDRNARTIALPALAAALRDRDEQVRGEAICALQGVLKELGPKAKAAVPALLAALKGDECNELHEVVDLLAEFGPAAKDAVPVLTQFLKMPPPKTRYRGLDDGLCLQGYSVEGWFQCRVYDALEKITGKPPSLPRPQPAQKPSPF